MNPVSCGMGPPCHGLHGLREILCVTDGVWKIGQFFICLKLFLSSLCGMEETAAIGDAVAMEIV